MSSVDGRNTLIEAPRHPAKRRILATAHQLAAHALRQLHFES